MERGLTVLVGGLMTHKQYLFSEGGYIADEAIDKMYLDAAKLGVVDFIVPGNRPEFISHIRHKILQTGIEPILYAPGFVAQGGNISEAAKVAGPKWHAIVGRAIYPFIKLAFICSYIKGIIIRPSLSSHYRMVT